jgi:cytochrome c
MDAFERNKISGAILSALLLIVSINVFTNAFFEKHPGHGVGYELPSDNSSGAASEKGSKTEEPTVPLPVLLAKADPARGEKALSKCKACHSFEKGGPNRVGPNLYDIINRTMGAAVGFNYSSAFKAKNEEKAVWTFEAIDNYLKNPKAYIKGTNMAFAGISKAEERADLIAYLRGLSDNPASLPAAPKSSELQQPLPKSGEEPVLESSAPHSQKVKSSATEEGGQLFDKHTPSKPKK